MTLRPTDSSLLLIDGKLVPGSGGTFEVINPATEEVLGAAADATPTDMDVAIAAARRAFDDTTWSRDHAFRARCLRQLRDALLAHIEEFREITIAEVGAPRFFTSGPQLEGPLPISVTSRAWRTAIPGNRTWVSRRRWESSRTGGS